MGGTCCTTLIYPGPRAITRGKIDEGTSPTAATVVGFALDPAMELCSFSAAIDRSCVIAVSNDLTPYLAGSLLCKHVTTKQT